MNISIWYITYQHCDEIINQSLNTCIILVGVGRIYSIHRGGSQKGEGIFSKFRRELAKRGGVKKSGGVGPWMKLCHYTKTTKEMGLKLPHESNDKAGK